MAAHGRFGFPRQSRLLLPADYRRVFAKAVRVSDQNFTLLARAGTEHSDGPQLGLAIAKKHIPRAVRRNLLKRIARESFRIRRDDLPTIDVVVLARAGANRSDRRSLRKSLDRLWADLSGKMRR